METRTITYKGVTKEVKFWKDQPWTDILAPDMIRYKEETGKDAVIRGRVTGTFCYWLYWAGEKKRTRRTKVELSKVKERKVIKRIYVEYTIEELLNITKKYRNQIPRTPALKQILTYVRKINYKGVNSNWEQIYKHEIIKIFDDNNVPYNKKKIKKIEQITYV